MREILFRGKRTDNGEWVYGVPWEALNGTGTIYIYGKFEIGGKTIMSHRRVYPETVGQFTGLTDKNGKKIFEGDIVLIKDFKHGVALNYEQPTSKWVVKWYEKTARFSIDYMEILPFDFTRSEVIGNIYDNPELLEG